VARLTENPKVIGGGILLALALGAYLHGPEFFRQVTAPPPKPAPPPKLAEAGTDEMKFYRMVPNKLPEKWPQLLVATNVPPTMFDEVPKSEGTRQQTVLPELTPGWHLSSTYISPEDRVAVVSGVMVREGDVLGPFTVKRIEEDKVTFRHPRGERQMGIGQFVPIPEGGGKTEAKPVSGKKPAGSSPGTNVLVKALEGLDKWRNAMEKVEEIKNSRSGSGDPPKPPP